MLLVVGILAAWIGGCAAPAPPSSTGLALSVTAPIEIPTGRAHAVFRQGRLVGGGSRLDPYCELEVRSVSGDEPQRITTGDFRVSRVTHRVLLDPTTRIPPLALMSSCLDPLFQESIWWLTSVELSDVLFLRCINPYYNCAFGPPLTPSEVQEQLGHYLMVHTIAPETITPGRW